jgi:hypothetical protein
MDWALKGESLHPTSSGFYPFFARKIYEVNAKWRDRSAGPHFFFQFLPVHSTNCKTLTYGCLCDDRKVANFLVLSSVPVNLALNDTVTVSVLAFLQKDPSYDNVHLQ